MSDSQQLKIERFEDSILVVTLNRPEKRNALSLSLMEELITTIEHAQYNSKTRVLILTGEGNTFCAGLDLQEASDPTLIEPMAQHVAYLFTTLYKTSLVTIAAVQGHAIAGGAGLVAACDCAVMAHNGFIGFPETRKGLVAAQVAALLRRQIALRHIRELLLIGELIDSRKAESFGLVNKITECDGVMKEAMQLAHHVLKGAPDATKASKRLLDFLDPVEFSNDVGIALSFHNEARHSKEAEEGINAFLEKRAPSWTL